MPAGPEPLAAALAGRLQPLGLELHYLQSTESSNDQAKAWVQEGRLKAPSLVFAQAQSAGRGTRGRQWHMSAGEDLALTLALPLQAVLSAGDPPLPDQRVPLLAAAACARVLEASLADSANCAIMLRWPNDVLAVPGGKLCGILCETSARWLFAGIGVNVNSRSRRYPPVWAPEAVSMRDLSGRRFDRIELAVSLAEALLAALARASNPAHWLREWSFRDATPGLRFRYDGEDGGELEAIGIDADSGGLWVKDAQGRRELVYSYTRLARLTEQDRRAANTEN
jgi:BirA family biotin operon repressor/biotin-[acetyl-CoA-carboxylase] ligase